MNEEIITVKNKPKFYIHQEVKWRDEKGRFVKVPSEDVKIDTINK